MEKRPRSLLLKFPGTNCDAESARALEAAGFSPQIVPIARLEAALLDDVRLVVLPGGFSYGDYVMSGRFASLITRQKIGDALRRFRDEGGFIFGICNGFQILTQIGLLPKGSLVDNSSGRYQCDWTGLNNEAGERSPFLRKLPDTFELPFAHAEGRFVTDTPEEAETYLREGKAALTYRGDVNGSFARIAGLQDDSGRVLGMMPHPERFLYQEDHYDPDWRSSEGNWGTGYLIFQSVREAVDGGV